MYILDKLPSFSVSLKWREYNFWFHWEVYSFKKEKPCAVWHAAKYLLHSKYLIKANYYCWTSISKTFTRDILYHSYCSGVLKARILKWFALPFSSGPRFVCLLRNLTLTTGHVTTDWFQIGKEYDKAVYWHSAYLTYVQSTSCEMPGWMKHKLKSRLPGEISITSGMQMTPPLWQKVKKN